MDAFERADHKALERFRLSKAEHNEVVWPEFPVAQAEHPFPVDLAWRNIQLRNQRAVRRASAALASIRRAGAVAYKNVACRSDAQVFATFSVHTDCYVSFSVGDRSYKMQLFKDVLVRHGGYKIFRYYDEDAKTAAGS